MASAETYLQADAGAFQIELLHDCWMLSYLTEVLEFPQIRRVEQISFLHMKPGFACYYESSYIPQTGKLQK